MQASSWFFRAGSACGFLGALAALAAGVWAAAPDQAADRIRQGDVLYAETKLAEADEAYREALRLNPTNFDALCRAARVESELGQNAKGDERKKLAAAAVEHARAAVHAAPDSAAGHAWLAVALGRQALGEGPKKRLALSREIKAEADRAIEIDPGMARAYHVRALWNRKIATLNLVERMAANTVLGGVPEGASMANAVRDLEKASALEPEYVNHHLELGRTFAMLHRDTEARRELERVIALPPTSNARDPVYQAEATELLKKLGR